MDLKDKVAIVTGGSSGIGKAISIALADENCKVVFTYNSNEKGGFLHRNIEVIYILKTLCP